MKTYKNAKETMEALIAGKKIHQRGWGHKDFIYLDDNGDIIDQYGFLVPIFDLGIIDKFDCFYDYIE